MDAEILEERIEFVSNSGRLEGVLAYPADGKPDARVLLLSPHPHLGGNMENNVIRHLARDCARLGLASLRFNYHGVGGSTMHEVTQVSPREYWSDIERTRSYARLLPDVEAAYDALRACVPNALETAVIGYSLGSVVMGLAAHMFPDATAIAIAPPVDHVTLTGFDQFRGTKAIVTGDQDFCFDETAFHQFYDSLSEPKHHLRFQVADHFYRKREAELFRSLTPFLPIACGVAPNGD
jgi:alpha/beta superfamily hydrolase